jgi:acylphosphatase
MKICKRGIVSGKVQGVFFRQGTQQQARAVGVKGWVRNLPNGDVECLLCGEAEIVEKLCVWLHQGPPAAKVTQVKMEETAWEAHEDFIVVS